MSRVALTRLPALVMRLSGWLPAALLLTGCPGTIDDPAPFFRAAGSSCPPNAEIEVQVLRENCAQLGCHTSGQFAAAGLDLLTPGSGARILNHRSSNEQCEGLEAIADPSDLPGSYFFEKLTGSPECGDPMPNGEELLDPRDVACLRVYVERFLRDAGGTGGEDAGSVDADGGAPASGGGPDGGP